MIDHRPLPAAFVFTSSADESGAWEVSARMRAHGWRVFVVGDQADMPTACDVSTAFDRGSRLTGTECVIGIMSTMLMHAGDSPVIAKVDADMVLTTDMAAWLAYTPPSAARMARIGVNTCSGLWAASPAILRSALGCVLAGAKCSTCPEARLMWSALRATARLEVSGVLQVWRPGRDVSDRACGITLPSRFRGAARVEAMAALHEAMVP